MNADTTGKGFIFDMFKAAMLEHEYIFTQDDGEILSACGVDPEELATNAAMKAAYISASEFVLSAE